MHFPESADNLKIKQQRRRRRQQKLHKENKSHRVKYLDQMNNFLIKTTNYECYTLEIEGEEGIEEA